MFWTAVRHSSSSVLQKGTPIYSRPRPGRRSSMLAASGASERMFRESYDHPYCPGFVDTSTLSAQTRGNGAVQLPSSTSTPCFLGCGSRLLPRRFSQQLYGPQISPTAVPREVEGADERASVPRGPLTYVMLPLDTVNAEGIFRYAGSSWFSQALQLLVSSGAHGVAMDFWWGAVEKSPGVYNWAGYKQVLEVIKQTGLKVQVVLSFHACGGNVGDTVQIPLPEWVSQCGEADPDLFFADRPRNGSLGNRNREYISIWADEAPGVLRGRSPLQCYEDFMISLRENFSQELGTVIDELVIGAGPCGELRLPSYVEANGWRFPGAGEFQCYDRRALASLAQAAREAGHPEWGYSGPHDAGEYNSLPEHTGFFSQNGSWNTPYGRFFLEWYSTCLLKHGERLLTVANQVFSSRLMSNYAASSQGLGLQSQQQQNNSSGGFAPSAFGGSAPSSSQPFLFRHNGSSGRISALSSLNRIPETGGADAGGGGGGEPASSSQDCIVVRQPSLPPPRRQADGAASISPSCTCSSISTGTISSNSSATGSIGAASLTGSGVIMMTNGGTGPPEAGGGMAAPHSIVVGGVSGGVGSAASPRMVTVGTLAGRVSAGGGGGSAGPTSMSDPGGGGGGAADDGVGAVLVRSAGMISACAATDLIQVPEAAVVVTGGGSGAGGGDSMRNASSGSSATGVGGLGSQGIVDTVMIDVEPSEVSHTSIVAAVEILPMPPSSSPPGSNEPLCQAPPIALPSSVGPSPLAVGRFRSSASTVLADPEPLSYGQSTTFTAAAAAAGVLLASAGTARMDMCASQSSLSTEYHAAGAGGGVGGGLQTASMLYMDVAASLVADGDDESDIGTTSCGTGVQEEADELFAMATTNMLAAATASSFGDDGSRSSADLGAMGMGLSMGVGQGVAAHGHGVLPPPPPASSLMGGAMTTVSSLQLMMSSPTGSGSGGGAAAAAGGGGAASGGAAAAAGGGGGLHLALKIAGIHWWYRSRSHAAELTAGYYNVEGRDGYAPIVELCARHRANLVLTCVEMCDAQHPAAAQCGPEGLLRQLRNLAARAGVALSGENALPIFSTGGVDADALDRIVQNMRPCPANTSASGSSARGISPAPSQLMPYLSSTTPALNTAQGYWLPPQQQQHQSAFAYPMPAPPTASVVGNNVLGVSYRMSESGRAVPVYSGGASMATQVIQDAHPQALTMAPAAMASGLWSYPSLESQLSYGGQAGACPSPAATAQPEVLPALRAFTFLRLVPEMLLPGYQSLWMRFMGKLQKVKTA
ncbi:Leucine-rich repeat receptor-like serine/threonine-protein kinase bam2 [Pleodorina starrii]|uniref:Beta-amylase n=1 Tax=Pleodorina starrii TaxID=330485 RepID=A0A9W6BY59_9CHLO|nr:Leucine-rich repeat receptor-like serine/threonine-protein kinase bam2 [Pleodorina starrii]GLC72853.1 Leucine-rich repeat receptor-like serine/threonine-protein kinase bam2 [Pleodorina starrii]